MKHPVLKTVLMGSVATLCATPTLADVTADDVWNSWKSLFELIPETELSATETRDGNTLIVSNLDFGASVEDVNISVDFGDMRFTENGDGSVSVDLANEMIFTVMEQDAEGVEITLSQSDMSIVASGDPDNIAYDYAADTYRVDFGLETSEIEEFGVFDYVVTLSDFKGRSEIDSRDGVIFSDKSRIGGTEVEFNFGEPGDPMYQRQVSTATDVTTDVKVVVPADFSMDDLSALHEGRVTFHADYGIGNQEMTMDMAQDGMEFSLSGVSEPSTGKAAFDADGLGLEMETGAMHYQFAVAGVPFPPVDLSLASSEFALDLPLFVSGKHQDFRLMMQLAGLELNDEVWGMIDPLGSIPRDPLEFEFDVSGKMSVLSSLLDFEALENSDEMPVLLHSADVDRLLLSVAGAMVAADGGFVFNNEDLMTFDGFPAPEGRISIKAAGIVTLMQVFAQMGLVPPDQVMGAQMMLGLFMRPGEGEDTWETEIDVHEDGSVFANGQQLQ